MSVRKLDRQRRERWGGAASEQASFGTQYAQVSDGALLKTAQFLAYLQQLFVDGVFGKLHGKILQALVNQLKLLDQAAQGIDALVQASVHPHHRTRSLDAD